jgi:hypothetical protein
LPPPKISFPSGRTPTDDGVRFPCIVDGHQIRCEVTFEALQDHFDATVQGNEFLDLFDRYRPHIETAAAKKIRGLRQISEIIIIDSADM